MRLARFAKLRISAEYFRLGISTIAQPFTLPSSQVSQPIPLDAQGDMKVDFLGYPFGDDKQQNLKIWRNSWLESNNTQFFTLSASYIVEC